MSTSDTDSVPLSLMQSQGERVCTSTQEPVSDA